jgi:hypothetical protein
VERPTVLAHDRAVDREPEVLDLAGLVVGADVHARAGVEVELETGRACALLHGGEGVDDKFETAGWAGQGFVAG